MSQTIYTQFLWKTIPSAQVRGTMNFSIHNALLLNSDICIHDGVQQGADSRNVWHLGGGALLIANFSMSFFGPGILDYFSIAIIIFIYCNSVP